MLLLTQTIGETIIIDDGIVITVTNVKGKNVKIGINAPKEIKILRKELKRIPGTISRPLMDSRPLPCRQASFSLTVNDK